jgi:hypothetical protein
MLIKTKSQDSKKRSDNQFNELYVATKPLEIDNKLMIDITDIKDFSFCPYYYYLKNRNANEINLSNLYDKAIHKTFYAYLLALQEDKLESTLEFLKYQWGKEWIKYRKVKTLIITISSINRDYHENLRKKGIDAIFNFDEIMSKEKQFPIIIGHKYQIEIIPNVILTGTYEYVREVTIGDKKVIQLVKFVTRPNRFDTNIAKLYDLELIAMSYAFKETFKVDYFQVVSIDIEQKKTLVNTYSDKEYKLLKETIKNVVICLQNNIQCISPNRQCFHCNYRNVCINQL